MPPLATQHDRIRVLASNRHYEFRSRTAAIRHADPLEVGRLASRLAGEFYAGEYSEEKVRKVAEIKQAGYLVYAMESYGLSYEDINDVAGHGVATIVSGLSSDLRLAPGPRSKHHASHIGQAGPGAQLVKLAEVICVGHQLAGRPVADWVAHADEIKRWAEDHVAVVAALRHLLGHPVFKEYVAQAQAMLVHLPRQVELASRTARRQARAARAARRAAGANLRQRAAAELRQAATATDGPGDGPCDEAITAAACTGSAN